MIQEVKSQCTKCPSAGEWLNELWHVHTPCKANPHDTKERTTDRGNNLDGFTGNYTL